MKIVDSLAVDIAKVAVDPEIEINFVVKGSLAVLVPVRDADAVLVRKHRSLSLGRSVEDCPDPLFRRQGRDAVAEHVERTDVSSQRRCKRRFDRKSHVPRERTTNVLNHNVEHMFFDFEVDHHKRPNLLLSQPLGLPDLSPGDESRDREHC